MAQPTPTPGPGNLGAYHYGVQWSYYGGTTENPLPTSKLAWEAFDADLAYSFVFGSRLFIYDVDVAINIDGVDQYNDTSDLITVDFWTENSELGTTSRSYFIELLESYHLTGFPNRSDKVAEALFFGEFQRTPALDWPGLIPKDFNRICKYNPYSEMVLDGEAIAEYNFSINSPAVIHSMWTVNTPAGKRLILVFSNFSDKSFTISTKPINLQTYLPLEIGSNQRHYEFEYIKPFTGSVHPSIVVNSVHPT